MKKVLLPVLLVLAYSLTTFGQWTAQTSGFTGLVYGIKAVNANVVWACGAKGTVLKTVNGGTTWVTKTPTDAARTNYGIDAIDSSTAWVISCDGTNSVDLKIWKTTDGGTTWVTKYTNPNNFADGIKMFDANNGVAWGDPEPYPSTKWEVARTTDGGNTWARVDPKNIAPADSVNGEYGAASALTINGNHAWFVGYSGATGSKEKVYHSTDKGATWTSASFAMVGGKSTSGYCAFSSTTKGAFVGFDGTTATTTDGGATWTTSSVTGATFRNIAAVLAVPDMYIAVGGPNSTTPQTWTSMDGGKTWTPVAVTGTEYLRAVETVGKSAFAGGNLGGIYKWSGPSLPVELTAFSAAQNGKYVNLTWSTATETNNRGFEIERKLAGDNNFVTVAFKNGAGTTSEARAYSYNDDISLFKVNSVVYRLKQFDFDGTYSYSKEVTVNVVAPVEYALDQNFPNPFNPTTSIKYSVAKAGLVTLKVYNTMGQEVASLVNEAKEIGSYEVNFNAANLSSGVYFYEINSGDFTSTKKMMLIK